MSGRYANYSDNLHCAVLRSQFSLAPLESPHRHLPAPLAPGCAEQADGSNTRGKQRAREVREEAAKGEGKR